MSCSEWKETYIGRLRKEWDVISLKDCTMKITDGTHSTVKDDPSGEYFLLSCKNIKNGNIVLGEKERKINYETLLKLRLRTGLQKDDILLTTVGTIGESAIIKEENIDFELQRSVAIIRANSEILLPDFLYYVTKSRIFKSQADGLVRGSVQKCLFIGAIGEIKIPVPSLKEQEKIVDILSSLDDKIELNNEMNKTLEEMAQSIFKRWFVDFEFPNEDGEPYKSSDGEMVESELGMIPKGWKVVTSEDICNFNKYSYSKKDNWNYINYLDTSNITKNKIDNIQKIDCINEKIPSRAKRKVSENSIVYSTVRPNQLHYGIIKKQVENMIVSTGFATIDSKYDYIKNDFIYYWLTQSQNTDKLQAIGETSTTTFPAIKATDIKKMKLVISDENMLREISNKLDKINLYLNDLREEEILLKEIRDSLLSKLMNGHI